MLRNIVLVLAPLALVSGMAVYSDNGLQSNHLVEATSTEPQVFGDTISIPTNEAAVPRCQSDTDKSTTPGCCSSIDKPRVPSCCGGVMTRERQGICKEPAKKETMKEISLEEKGRYKRC